MMSCLKCLVSVTVTHKLLPTVDTVTGLVLCQGYVPEKVPQIEHKLPFKNSVFPCG